MFKTHSVLTRVLIPYKYLSLPEKFFLLVNTLGLLLVLFSLILLILRGIQGNPEGFGMGDWVLLFAIMQSIPTLRYRGLTRIPTSELDEKLQNQLIQSNKFEWMYSLKSSIFLWLLVIGWTIFSLCLTANLF